MGGVSCFSALNFCGCRDRVISSYAFYPPKPPSYKNYNHFTMNLLFLYIIRIFNYRKFQG